MRLCFTFHVFQEMVKPQMDINNFKALCALLVFQVIALNLTLGMTQDIYSNTFVT